MVFEALASELSLDKSDYTRGLKAAAKETMTFGKVAKSNFDKAGDEAEEAGDKARNAAFGFAALRFSTSGLSFSLGALTGIGSATTFMLIGLAGAVGALMLAMAPVAIGALAVASAFGVIVGSGIYAGMEELKTAFGDALAEIKPMVKELGERFVPFLKETIGMLPGLVSSIIDAIGPLDQFFNALKTLRNAAFDLLPKLIKWFIDLGRWALPILKGIGNWIVSDLAPAFRKLINRGKSLWKQLVNLKPEFNKLITHGKNLWKWLKGLWQQFQKSTAKGTKFRKKLTGLIDAGKRFWKEALKPTLKALKPLVKELIKAAPVFAGIAADVGKLAFQIGTKLLPVLKPVIKFVTKAVKWFNDLAGPVKYTALVVGGLYAALTLLTPALYAAGAAVWTMTFPISATTLALVGLGIAVVALADYIYKNWSDIVKWTKDLASDVTWWMDRIATKISDAITGAIDGVVSWLKGAAKTDVVGALKSMGGAVAGAFKGAFNAAMPDSIGIPKITIGRGVPGPDYTFGGGALNLPQLDTGGFIQSGGLAMLHEGEEVIPKAQVDRGGGSGTQDVNVTVNIDTEDEALQQWVDERADVVVEKNVNETKRKMKRRGAV